MKQWRLITGMLVFSLLSLLCSVNSWAAFPSNLAEKHLKAYAMSDQVILYPDASLQGEGQTMEGKGFLFEATDVRDDQAALYGIYYNSNTGETGQGWVASSHFLYNPSFKHVYATVRARMPIYTTGNLSRVQDHIRKYSGIIAVGKGNGAVQVIYETNEGYGMGWLSSENYANKLVYDGRDKKVLADGSYTFSTVSDLLQGILPVPGESFRLEYANKGKYRIVDMAQNQYLKILSSPLTEELPVEERDLSWQKKGFFDFILRLFSAEYREHYKELEEAEKEQQAKEEAYEADIASGLIFQDPEEQLQYQITWTADAADAALFHIERKGYYFTILVGDSEICLGQSQKADAANGEKILTLIREASLNYINPEELTTHFLWRARAQSSMVDPSDPMVITQYDPEWCANSYGSEGCIGTAGCGLLSTVNAVYALTGQYMSVMELADYAVETGYRIVGSGTSDGIFKAAAETYGDKYGFAYDGKTEKLSVLKKKLMEGDVAISHVIGHYVAITAYDPVKNRYLLLDSNTLPKRATTAFGDWVSPSRLVDGYLMGQMYFFFKQAVDQ